MTAAAMQQEIPQAGVQRASRSGAAPRQRQRRGAGGRNAARCGGGGTGSGNGCGDASASSQQPCQRAHQAKTQQPKRRQETLLQTQQNNRAINRQVTSAAETGNLSVLLTLVQQRLPEMNGINLATALHRVAKLAASPSRTAQDGKEYQDPLKTVRQSQAVQDLVAAIDTHVRNHSLLLPEVAMDSKHNHGGQVDEMPAQCVSIVAWSCATLRLNPEPLLTNIATLISPRLYDLKPFELSNLLWAYAKLNASPYEFSKTVAERLLNRKDGEFKVQCLSTVTWAFTTMRQRHVQLFNSLAWELAARACEMKTQEISNTLWAYAKAQASGKNGAFQHAPLFHALAGASLRDSYIWQFKAQELSNTVWAFATVGLRHPHLFTAVEEAALKQRAELAPQHVANILWAFARLQVTTSKHIFPVLLDLAVSRWSRFKPQEITALVWAAAEACPDKADFFRIVASDCARRVAEFTPNALANLAQVFAGLHKVNTSTVLEAIINQSIRRLNLLEPAALCKLLRAVVEAAPQLPPGLSERLAAAVADKFGAPAFPGDGAAPRASRRLPLSVLQDVAATLRAQGLAAGTELMEQALARVVGDRRRSDSDCPSSSVGGGNVAFGSTEVACGADAESDGEDENCDSRDDPATESDDDCKTGPRQMAKSIASASTSVDSGSQDGGDSRWNLLGDSEPLTVGTNLTSAAKPVSAAGFRHSSVDLIPCKGVPMRVPLPTAISAGVTQALLDSAPWSVAVGPGPVRATALAANESNVLRVVDVSCLTEVHTDGQLRNADLWPLVNGDVVELGAGPGTPVVCVRQGLLDGRVFLRRVPMEACPTASTLPAGGLNILGSNHVLRPVARVLDPVACTKGFAILAYPHCAHGTLAEWASARLAAGRPVTATDAARVVHGVLLASVALIETNGPEALNAVQADEVFIGDGQKPMLREPLRGTALEWHDSLRWLSPEEATGRVSADSKDARSVDAVWPSLAHRLGLLLYCLGSSCSGEAVVMDPYPCQSGEAVLLSLLNEARSGSPPVRPDLSRWQGPGILKQLLAALLRTGGQQPPARAIAEAVLETVAKTPAGAPLW